MAMSENSSDRSDDMKRQSMRRLLAFSLVSLVWVLAVLMCYAQFLAYEAKPAETETPPAVWPPESALPLATGRMNLVMFIHPKCPCTNASLNELAILMTRCAPNVKAYAVFLKPDGVDEDWEKTTYWQRASEIPGVRVVSDIGERESRRFNATTSGETLLFGADGRLLFAGGITGARGHEGDNQGLDSIVAIVKEGDVRCPRTGVFGCGLRCPVDGGIRTEQGIRK
jgi:hypothetical protein